METGRLVDFFWSYRDGPARKWKQFHGGETIRSYVIDRDSGDFAVEGPMNDGRPWKSAVVSAQDAVAAVVFSAWVI